MLRTSLCIGLLALCALAADWPDFRGPAGNGHSVETGVPLTWSESDNVGWKASLPGRGWSTPIIVGGEVWLTTATDGDRSLRVLALDASSGKLKHNVEVFRLTASVHMHEKNSGASPSILIEGDLVYAHFGAYGTACLRKDGTIVWRNQELKFFQVHGPGGSPVLYGDLLIFNCDGNDTQFVAALNKKTGKLAWRKDRPSAMAYATPLVIQLPGGPQLISPGAHRAVSYDPRNGNELWSVNYGDGFSNVPRPVFANGLVYICTGFNQPQLFAVRPDGRGDVTATHIAWKATRGVPHTPSPISVGDRLYFVSDGGIASSLDAKTGREIWRQRLGGTFSASPVFAEGRLYFLNEDGEASVIAPEDTFRKLAANKLAGRFLASISISERSFFLRSDTHLYRITSQRN